jgi:hypothetical protein
VPTLHIEHPITDLATWTGAFNGLAGARLKAGVRREQVRRPFDRTNYVVIDLDFDSIDEAQKFLRFLQTQIWKKPDNSPALAGTPETMILEAVVPVATPAGSD